MQKLTIVTGNPLKFRQLSHALGDYFDCEQKDLEGYAEIQGTPDEIRNHKLDTAYKTFGTAVLVDDVSLHMELLGGFPGPYIRSFLEQMPPHVMGRKFAGERIRVVCRLGLRFKEGDDVLAEGSFDGMFVAPRDGVEHKWNFDICVQIDGTDKPMAEFSTEEINKISHRGNAIRDLISKLKNRSLN